MNFQFKLIVTNQSVYKEFEILPGMERVKVGTTSECDFRLNPDFFFEEIELTLEKREQWNISCGDNLYISRGDVRKLFFTDLVHGDKVRICYGSSGGRACTIRFMIDFQAEIPRYQWKIGLAAYDQIIISDQNGANIQLLSEFGRNTYVRILRRGSGYTVSESSSRYGIYINGKKAFPETTLSDHDFLSIADFSAYFCHGMLYVCDRNIQFNHVNVAKEGLAVDTSYPLFVRNTRIRSKSNDEEINILDPAAIPTEPELNIVTSLIPAIVMFVLIVVLRGFMSKTGSAFVLFSICSMGLGVITSVFTLVDKKKKYRKNCEDRRTTYLAYVERKQREIETARNAELQCMREQYYSTMEDLQHIQTFSPCLFDRIPEDEDFLDCYLGLGIVEAKQKVSYKQQERLELGDDLCQIPNQIEEGYRYIQNAPVVVSLKDANAVGVVGKERKLYEMMKVMITDIISRQYYGDVAVYALLDESYRQYEWLKDLPHIQGVVQKRNIVCDIESKNNIFENLYKELSYRSSLKEQKGFNVIFVMAEQGIKSHPISKFIEEAASLNTVFIFFEKSMDLLPLHCSQIIQLGKGQTACLYSAEDKTKVQSFVYDPISDQSLKEAAKILSPVYCEEISLESSLRKSISLFELMGIYSVGDIDLDGRWKQSKVYDSMAVPLGVNAKDEIVCLDLHEKFHGPHGLVAGTTGSGKSEILQTFILGAATLFHPYEIGFVIIDFKGGGMVNQFKNLPHLLGAITNIDGKQIDRSLKSIKAELLKRQTLFAEVEVNHIDKYIKAYKEGKAKTALPHLIIIVDEFAELKAEQPEFMKELISAARIGRSLGVHLILATQKPSGQVDDQIWSNSRFHLCLKVQTQQDSNEVLKSPLAAEIREPGRAYLQVGNNELFELLQSGYSGSPEKSDGNNTKSFDICQLDFKGNRSLLYRQRPQKNAESRTQLEAVVQYVADHCNKRRIPRLPEICLPPLPEKILCERRGLERDKDPQFSVPIGIFDDPDFQRQEPAWINAGSENTLIIGAAQFGKTNLLQSMLRSLAEKYTPEEVNIYIIDFASRVLKNFEKLAHVGGVVCPADDEKLKNLFKFLTDQINDRREKLLAVGVSSFTSYLEAGYRELPQIIVMIDNMTALKELYLQDSDVLLNLCREGTSVGISFIVTNNQTQGFGYKYLANFSSRIALFCTEPAEYINIFGSCRMRPDEVPGRCLVEIDKAFYECQTYLTFEGEKEIERVRAMQEFIKETNAVYAGQKALPIPEIPDLMTENYIFDTYPIRPEDTKLVMGINYDTVMPVLADTMKRNFIGISGTDSSGKTNYMRYLIHSLARVHKEHKIILFDDYRKKLSGIPQQLPDTEYYTTPEKCKEVLTELNGICEERYMKMVMGEALPNQWMILVLNNDDAITGISGDRELTGIFKNLVSRFKLLNIFVIIGKIPNAPIVYGAPELYKLVKDERCLMFFDDLENCKALDIPLTIARNFRKKISLGDAYYISGNECCKLKTPLAAKE